MLSRISWRRNEQVLDIGMGLGLLPIGAAKQLDRGGRATGIDIWRTEDLSGGGLDRPAHNAAVEGVENRIALLTHDARSLSMADDLVDVALSLFCIHNIQDKSEQRQVLLDIVRVPRPGGRVLIGEWLPIARYADIFKEAGPVIRSYGSHFGTAMALMWMVDAEQPLTEPPSPTVGV